jgi:hypothetical protein
VLACAKDRDDETIRHIKVVTGNRMPPGTDGLEFRLEGAHIVVGGEPVVKAVLLGESNQDINELLQSEVTGTKSNKARERCLDILEEAPGMEMESDTLDAMVAKDVGCSVRTLKRTRAMLKDEGLIKPVPHRNESGVVESWTVKRTLAPR